MSAASAHWLLVPVVAVVATLAGAVAVFAVSVGLAGVAPAGESSLGIGVWTMVGLVLAIFASAVAGLAVGAGRRETIASAGAATGQGLRLAATVTGGYLVAALLIQVVLRLG